MRLYFLAHMVIDNFSPIPVVKETTREREKKKSSRGRNGCNTSSHSRWKSLLSRVAPDTRQEKLSQQIIRQSEQYHQKSRNLVLRARHSGCEDASFPAFLWREILFHQLRLLLTHNVILFKILSYTWIIATKPPKFHMAIVNMIVLWEDNTHALSYTILSPLEASFS